LELARYTSLAAADIEDIAFTVPDELGQMLAIGPERVVPRRAGPRDPLVRKTRPMLPIARSGRQIRDPSPGGEASVLNRAGAWCASIRSSKEECGRPVVSEDGHAGRALHLRRVPSARRRSGQPGLPCAERPQPPGRRGG